ncbi:hypothetical protein FDECE_14299 [Fusarium decemcellulare]|nr:hypothetical protein FDECE_14299 [Fusarium decemcellulare]
MATHILVVSAGGTITGGATSEHSVTGYQSGKYPVEVLAKGFPQDKYNIVLECVNFRSKDSIDLTTEDVVDLCNLVHNRLDSSLPTIQGVVVVYGTDTKKEVALGLYCTRRGRKPIVVTSAVRPLSAIGTDSSRNFFTAIIVAASPLAWGRDVMIISNDDIWPCISTSKWDINTPSAFSSYHCGALGRVVDDKPFFNSDAGTPFQQIVDARKLKTEVPQVALFYAHPEFNPDLVREAIRHGAKAIVFAGFGKGFWGESRVKIKEILDQKSGALSAALDGFQTDVCGLGYKLNTSSFSIAHAEP